MFGVESPLPLYRRAELLRIRGKRTSAEADLLKALKIDQTFTPAREDLARVLFENKKYAFAASALERVKEDTQGEMNAELYYMLGMAYHDLGEIEAAVLSLEQARDRGFSDTGGTGVLSVIDPAIVHHVLGLLYRDRGRRADAIQELERYLLKAKDLDRSTRMQVEMEIAKIR